MNMPEFPADQAEYDGPNARLVNAADATITAHNDRAGYVIDDREHGLHMLLVDLLAYCEAHSINFERETREARGTLDDVRE